MFGAPAQLAAAPALPDRKAPVVTLRRAGSRVRLTLDERATVTATLRGRGRVVTRKLTLSAGRHTLPHTLERGRYTLTVRATDRAGNTVRRVLRFSA